MRNIKIEEVGDINFDFPYLEVFFKNDKNPFLEIGISNEKLLCFKFYSSPIDISINLEDWEHINLNAKEFFIEALKNDKDFLDLTSNV